METWWGAAHHIYDNIWASRSLQHQPINTLRANPDPLHQSMEKTLAKK